MFGQNTPFVSNKTCLEMSKNVFVGEVSMSIVENVDGEVHSVW